MPLIVTACVLPNADVYYVLEIKEYIKTMAKCRFWPIMHYHSFIAIYFLSIKYLYLVAAQGTNM